MTPEILLAIRVGPSSLVPARVALDLARRIGAHLTVLNVAPELRAVDIAGSGGLSIEDEQQRILADAEEALSGFLAEHLGGAGASARVAAGPVGERVAEIATELNADYVVVGTHGRGTLARLVLGDTTQSILQHTTRPVLVVPLPSDKASDG